VNKAIIEQLSVQAGRDGDLYLVCEWTGRVAGCAWEINLKSNGMLLSELLSRGVEHFRQQHEVPGKLHDAGSRG
jgi:hypothetical protein